MHGRIWSIGTAGTTFILVLHRIVFDAHKSNALANIYVILWMIGSLALAIGFKYVGRIYFVSFFSSSIVFYGMMEFKQH